MQTKNINVEQAPLNNSPQKLLLMGQTTPVGDSNSCTTNSGAPPALPPRGTIVFTPLHSSATFLLNNRAEVEGYGPYKPVPPPKPLSTSTPTSSFTPPPYRMPPYPLYTEPTVPGSCAAPPAEECTTPITGPLHTHSNKFPIEREVILSNGDKNSKIPILNEYKKRTKAAIAPDIPPKQFGAWTQASNDSQNYSTVQVHHVQPNPDVRQYQQPPYHSSQDVYSYNEQVGLGSSTGAVPKTSWHGSTRPSETIPTTSNHQTQPTPILVETTKESNGISKESTKNTKTVTKTYQTIRGMISSRFKSGKETTDVEKNGIGDGEAGLNNVADELRKSSRSLDFSKEEQVNGEERQITSILKKPAGEQGIYGKPRTEQNQRSDMLNIHQQQHQFNQMQKQQMLQSHQQMQIQMQQQQYLQAGPSYPYQMVSGRQQENLSSRTQQQGLPTNQMFYHGVGCNVTPQRPTNRYGLQQAPDQGYMLMRHPQYGDIKVHADIVNEKLADDRRTCVGLESRSPQQLNRDGVQQGSFTEARRVASQPHLADDQSKNEIKHLDGRASVHPMDIPVRRGSHGNIMDSYNAKIVNADNEKDSDDGGFIKRKTDEPLTNSQQNAVKNGLVPQDKEPGTEKMNESCGSDIKNESISQITEKGDLTGTPRMKLEGEIGKIEGVYNIGQQNERIELNTTEISEKGIDANQRKINTGSGTSSDYDKAGQSSSNADSGRGSAAYSSGRRQRPEDLNTDLHRMQSGNYGARDESEWVDIVDSELRHILEPKLQGLSIQGANGHTVANSTLSDSISSMTPPLPPLSPGDGSTPNITPRNSARYKHSASLPYGSKPDYDNYSKQGKGILGSMGTSSGVNSRWQNFPSPSKHRSQGKKHEVSILKGKHLYGLDLADITSTTTRSVDMESMLDGQSDSDGDISTTDARAIRKQLEGLENMYSEVLKLLGVKKYMGRYQPSDPRFSKRRYGSMSSLPSSSVSSRPIRDKRTRAHEERKKVKDLRGINKRFQRLESHVVTLARSVAHLSSEMRTQHLMIQEMENIREEISALRTQTNLATARMQSIPRGLNVQAEMPSLANPNRVKKLTKFFGDEPPLLRLFLKSLGYEKYANAFENERVGMVELPYLSEERLQKIGIPLGPRLRILQEAQISVCKDTTMCIV